jgi:tetrapyrrole methylase family protein/MazG family protein
LVVALLAWPRVGLDPMATGARVVDGRALDLAVAEADAPLLIAQCDHPLVLSDVKVTLLERRDPATTVTVLQRLGLPDELVTEVALAELDRAVETDHLTSVWVPGAPTSATRELARLLVLAERLRAPDGCPWDAEQTHHSLTRYLLEESYEVVEAVERLPADAPEGTAPDDPAYAALVDELGDLLYQVIFHAVLAEEAGAFGMADVAQGIHDKLVRRHPHVFGDVDAATSDAVMANWEQIKKAEKGVESIVAGITPGLPSLLYAHKLLRKGASVGLDPGDVTATLGRIDGATAALRAGSGDPETVLGELLAATVALARAMGVDTESALRGWAARFKERFEQMERTAATRGLDLHTLAPSDVEVLWVEAGDAHPA